jgi:glycosyltransferase involved in cell wall biosynthesis
LLCLLIPTDFAAFFNAWAGVSQPNADGLRWFLDEVYPHLTESWGEVPLTIVGTPRPKEFDQRGLPSVKTIGWVEDLAAVYRGAAVAIAPMRWGAGVKGKVGEAWSYGVPVVMTSIAAEGMLMGDGEISELVADDPRVFAGNIVKLLSDEKLWGHMSKKSIEHVESYFGVKPLLTALKLIVERMGPLPSRHPK